VVTGTLFTSSLAAYSFAKIRFSGHRQIYGIFIGTLMIPAQLTLIPLYIIFSRLHFSGHLLAADPPYGDDQRLRDLPDPLVHGIDPRQLH
jgi:multiple sugar transport system permease protein